MKTQMSAFDIVSDSVMYEPDRYGQIDFDKNFLLQVRKDTLESIAFRAFTTLKSLEAERNMRRPDQARLDQLEAQASNWAADLKTFAAEYYTPSAIDSFVERVGNNVLNAQEVVVEQTARGFTAQELKDMDKADRKEVLKPYTKLGVKKPLARQLAIYDVPIHLVQTYVTAGMDVRDLIRMEKQVLQRDLKRNATRVKAATTVEEEYLTLLLDAPDWAELRDAEAIEAMVVDRLDKLETRVNSPKMQASAEIKGWQDKLVEAQKQVRAWMEALTSTQEHIARESDTDDRAGYDPSGVH